MQLSAEIRWFWRDSPPPGLENWFCRADAHECPAGGGETRVDEYLRDPEQIELGIKRRAGKGGVEVKGLVAVNWNSLAVGPFVGPVEIWTKWTSEPLELTSGSLIAVEKRRWLRKFDTAAALPQEIPLDDQEQPLDRRSFPALGCNVELTRVGLGNGGVWWTFGLEAFGPLRTVENDLRAAATVLAMRRPPPLGEGRLASYPVWLREVVRQT